MQDRATHPYGIQDVERLLRLPRTAIRAFVTAGFVAPARGARNALRFSFQDLIVLRTAQALADARVPQRRITRSLKALRRQLPVSMPLSGLAISAVGDRVVVKEGAGRWQADSGQYLLGFEGDPAAGALSVSLPLPREMRPAPASLGPGAGERVADAQALYAEAYALEDAHPEEALRAYGQAIAADPALTDARLNLGRLLHELGRHAAAEKVYREALRADAGDALLRFNFGVLMEDMGRPAEARDAYLEALRIDPGMADCHYNLGLLCEKLARPREAIRHMSHYRALARSRD